MLIPKKATTYVVAFLLWVLVCFSFFYANSVLAESKLTTQVDKNSDAAVESDPSKTKHHNLYLSLGDEFNVPLKQGQDIFDCTDKIYSVVELFSYPLGKHHLSVRWRDPNGTVREHTQYDFHVRNNNTRLWAWLVLSRGFGGGMLQWANPAAGLEDFIGIWEIDVKINGKPIDKNNFEVSC